MANATIAGSNLYSTEWSGPPATDYSLDDMSSALSALIAAIGPSPSQNQAASAPSSSGSAAPSSSGSAAPSNNKHGASIAHLCAVYEVISFVGHHSVSHGAVIGISIAGAAIVCLIMAYIIARAYWKRRQVTSELPDTLIAPFSSVSNVQSPDIEGSDSHLHRLQTIRRF
jgi:hypothetical protein